MPLPSQSFSVVKAAEQVAWVRLTLPNLDDGVAEAVGPELQALAEQLAGVELRLDMDEVDYLGSTALGKLVVLHKKLAAAGGRLVLVNVNDFPYELFQVTRLNEVLDVRRKGADSGALATTCP